MFVGWQFRAIFFFHAFVHEHNYTFGLLVINSNNVALRGIIDISEKEKRPLSKPLSDAGRSFETPLSL